MADVFDFYVYDNRSIVHTSPEPIMQEDKDVAVWRFRIPKVLNNIDMSAWSWWFVYVNAKNQKFSELLFLNDDIDDPDNFSTADYSIGYGISKTPGGFTFALEAINAEQGGEISGEWHTRTYTHTVTPTLQGNQAEHAETESDVISALMQEVRTRMNQVIGGATPLPVNLKSQMTDHDKVYLYTGSEPNESTGYWYYWNGTNFVPGGVYGVGDPESVQGYVEDWLNDHPEATTTVQDGAITEAKLNADLKAFVNNVKDAFKINNKFIKNIVFADYLTGLSGTYSPQGFCYDPYRDVFIFCFSKGTEESLLVKTDTNFEYISRVELPLYHCNDITCDEDNYYIAFGSNATNYNIGIVNASNMAVYESVTIPTLGSIAAIQYYEGAFYAFCETGMYKFDDLESNPVLLTQIERSSNYIGSMAGFNDSIIIPFWYAENDESVFEYAVVNLQSLAISRFYLNGADRTDELEGVTIYNGKILTYSYSGNYLNVYETRQNDLTERNYNSIKRIRYTTSSTVLEDVVDNIPANNPIVNYVQFSNSHPDLGGFNGVLVSYMYNNPKYGFQIFASANGIYKRNISNGSFSDFEKVLTSSDDATTSVRLSNSTITKGITFYRKRGIISVHSSGDLAASAAGTYDYGTLPEAYRPVVPVCIMPQNNVSPKCYIRIESSGAVKLYVLETTTGASNACMNMSYISAN